MVMINYSINNNLPVSKSLAGASKTTLDNKRLAISETQFKLTALLKAIFMM